MLVFVSSGIFFYRRVGNLPPLACLKFASKEKYFGIFVVQAL